MSQNEKAPSHGNGNEADTYKNTLYYSNKFNLSQLSKSRMVLEHLLDGETLTPKFALKNFGLFSLASRICELKKIGYPITKILIEVRDGSGRQSRVAQYFIPSEFLEEAQELKLQLSSNKVTQGVIHD
jgi:hypothetical protein